VPTMEAIGDGPLGGSLSLPSWSAIIFPAMARSFTPGGRDWASIGPAGAAMEGIHLLF